MLLRRLQAKAPNKIYQDTAEKFRNNKKTWLLLSHARAPLLKFLLDLLDRQGTRIESFEQKGAAIYLYDLSQNPE